MTGKTHQLRVHLAFLGFPIANDPLYNPAALAALRAEDAVVEAAGASSAAAEGAGAAAAAVPAATSTLAASSATPAAVVNGIPCPVSEATLRSLCVSCTQGERAEFNEMQRLCSSIFLHAFEYAGRMPLQEGQAEQEEESGAAAGGAAGGAAGAAGRTAGAQSRSPKTGDEHGWRVRTSIPAWAAPAAAALQLEEERGSS